MNRFIRKPAKIKYIRHQFKNNIIVNNDKKADTMTDISEIEKIIDKGAKRKTKIEKKEKGLIERTEESTILLTEDNKMLLND